MCICMTDRLWAKGSKRIFTWAVSVWDTVPDVSWVGFVFVCLRGYNSRVSEWVSHWQLSPSPWAGEAACCVGRGYTCSGPVRPRYRYTSHLRPAPSCRSASPPLGSGTGPAENTQTCYISDQAERAVVSVCCCLSTPLLSRPFKMHEGRQDILFCHHVSTVIWKVFHPYKTFLN